jgi:hypothetical protein
MDAAGVDERDEDVEVLGRVLSRTDFRFLWYHCELYVGLEHLGMTFGHVGVDRELCFTAFWADYGGDSVGS